MTCKYQDFQVGDRLVITAVGNCTKCNQPITVRSASVIYAGHDEVAGVLCDMLTFISMPKCYSCSALATGINDPCDGKFSGGIFEEAFRQVEVENVSID